MPRREPQQKQKGPRHRQSAELPPLVTAAAERFVAACAASSSSDADLLKPTGTAVTETFLRGSVEQQSRTVASWAAVLQRVSTLVQSCRGLVEGPAGALESQPGWVHLLRLVVVCQLHSSLAHLQKPAATVLAAARASAGGDGSGGDVVVAALRKLFVAALDDWVEEAWRAIGEPGEQPAEGFDGRQLHAREVMRTATDLDAMMDHHAAGPKRRPGAAGASGTSEIYAEPFADAFPKLLPVLSRGSELAKGWASCDGASAAAGTAMDDLRYVLRMSVYLVQRNRAQASEALTALRGGAAGGDRKTDAAAAMLSIGNTADALLQDAVRMPKDCLNQAGVAVALVLQAAFPQRAAGAHMAEWLWACLRERSPAPSDPPTFTDAVLKADPPTGKRWFSALPYMGCCAVLRGAANCCDDSALLGSVGADGACVLLGAALPFTLPMCRGSDSQQRVLGLQTVELLLRKLHDALRKSASEEEGAGFKLEYGDPVRGALADVLDAIWECWEDTSAMVGHLLKDIFDTTLNVHTALVALHESRGTPVTASRGPLDIGELCDQLCAAHWHRRGKYAALLAMLPHVGAEGLRRRCPSIGRSVCSAMGSKTLAHTAGAFYAVFAAQLRRCTADADWEAEILHPAADTLLTGPGGRMTEAEEGLVRDGVLHYAIRPLLELSGVPDMVLRALGERARACLDGDVDEATVVRRYIAAHTQVMRVGKLHAKAVEDPVVAAAVVSLRAGVRMQALELMALGRRQVELPSARECSVVEAFVVRNLKTSDQSLRSVLVQFLRKWLQRCCDSLHRYETDLVHGKVEANAEARGEVDRHLLWIARHLVLCCYAGSPLERRVCALDLLRHLVATFRATSTDKGLAAAAARSVEKVAVSALPAELVFALLASLRESWDRVRLSAWELLRLAPAPLPGLEDTAVVLDLARGAAADLVTSKIKTADAGALVWRLVHRKYGVDLGWKVMVGTDGEPVVAADGGVGGGYAQQLCGLQSLTDFLQHRHGAGASRFAAVHGVVAAMRHVVADTDLSSLTAHSKTAAAALADGVDGKAWRAALQRAAEVVTAVCADAMKLVACVARGTDADDSDDDGPIGVDCRGHAFYADRQDDSGDRLVVVNAWLAVKEGCTLLADVITTVPLAGAGHPTELFPAADVRRAGDFLVRMVLASKHNGAIAKAAAALHRLCFRCLRCTLPELRCLPSEWLAGLLDEGGVKSKDETRALRRSGGLPPALLAVLEAEDHDAGVPVLAHRTMESLLAVAERGSSSEAVLVPVESRTAAVGTEVRITLPGGSEPVWGVVTQVSGPVLMLRVGDKEAEVPRQWWDGDGQAVTAIDEPRINALNTLKYLVESTALKEVVQSYAPRCLVLALRGLDRTQLGKTWMLRNSSLMLFSAMTYRAVGVARAAGGRTSLKEFITRYSDAVPVLLKALRETEAGGSLHESLFPILLLLSILVPSTDDVASASQRMYFGGDVEGAVSRGGTAAELLALVDRCHSLRDGMARATAARAFAPLIAPDALVAAAEAVAGHLPSPGEAVNNNSAHGRLLQLDALLKSAASLEQQARSDLICKVCAVLARRGWPAAAEPAARGTRHGICALVAALWWEVASEHLLRPGSAVPADFAEACVKSSRALPAPERMDVGAPRFASAVAAAHLAALRVTGRDEEAAEFTRNAIRDRADVTAAVLAVVSADPPRWFRERPLRRALLEQACARADEAREKPAAGCGILFARSTQALLEAATSACYASAEPDADAVQRLWALESVPNPAVVAAVLSTQGALLGAAVRSGGLREACGRRLAESVLRCSHPSRSVDLRQGSADALRAVNLPLLLQRCRDGGDEGAEAAQLLPLFLRAAAMLLCDEQDIVRDAASGLVPGPSGTMSGVPLGAGVPQCERAMEQCIGCFVAVAESHPQQVLLCLEQLGTILLHPVTAGLSSVVFEAATVSHDAPPGLPFSTALIAGRDGIVFDSDSENYWAEDLATCQLAARALTRLAHSHRSPATAEFFCRLAARAVTETKAAADALQGVGSARPLAFVSVFRLRLVAAICSGVEGAAGSVEQILRLLPLARTEGLWLSRLDDALAARKSCGVAADAIESSLFLLPSAS
eukprot:TRINITY_DN30489_c0_g1_i1.p1 TRINITY_DN30489_c0_g1~~TRINITY_DN30489_c0_g1_i1.p1  ORF type:complete len:2118 (+),score=676.16 TRINITY_DN30489_c0_g1_i1:56-6355(+)